MTWAAKWGKTKNPVRAKTSSLNSGSLSALLDWKGLHLSLSEMSSFRQTMRVWSTCLMMLIGGRGSGGSLRQPGMRLTGTKLCDETRRLAYGEIPNEGQTDCGGPDDQVGRAMQRGRRSRLRRPRCFPRAPPQKPAALR